MFEEYKGIIKNPSSHAMKRFLDKERFSEAGKEKFKINLDIVLNRTIDKIFETYTYDTADSTCLVHSKSTQIGFVFEWKDCVVTIITFFPLKKFHNSKDNKDIILIVEQDAMKKMGTKRLQEVTQEGMYDRLKLYDDNLEVYFWEGRLYDLGCDILIVD